VLSAYRTSVYSEQTDRINLFLLHTFQIQNACITETCEIFQDEKYFSMSAQPLSVLPVS
jgi:hypothetical protein